MRSGLLRVALLLLLARGLPCEPVYYVSNSLGMKLLCIPAYRADEFDHILSVTVDGDTTVERLLGREGETQTEIARWEHGFTVEGDREEREFSRGALVAARLSDKQGRLVEEQIHRSGELVETARLRYANGVLVEVVSTDAEGAVIVRVRYTTAVDGRLRRVEWEGGRATYAGTTERVFDETLRMEEKTYTTRYGSQGQTTAFETMRSGELTHGTYTSYAPGTADPLDREDLDVRAGTRTVRRYDEEGHEVERLEHLDGMVVSEHVFVYDTDGRRIEEQKRSEVGLELWSFTYQPDGEVATKEHRLRGSLRSRTVYTGDDEYYEDLYASPGSYVRIYVRGGEKVREEFYQKGSLVRERTYGDEQ